MVVLVLLARSRTSSTISTMNRSASCKSTFSSIRMLVFAVLVLLMVQLVWCNSSFMIALFIDIALDLVLVKCQCVYMCNADGT